MSVIDICLLVPLLWGAARGLYKGLVSTVCSIVGVVAGLYLSSAKAADGAALLSQWFELNDHQLYVIAYILIFVVTVLLVLLLSQLIEHFLKLVTLSWLNRVLGALFGVVKYALIVSLVLNLVDVFHQRTGLLKQQGSQDSYFYEPLKNFGPMVLPYFSFYVNQTDEEDGSEEIVG